MRGSMSKRGKPLVWSTIKDVAGVVLGSYAIDGRLMVVRSAVNGEEEWTQLGGSATSPETLARTILSEPKMREAAPD